MKIPKRFCSVCNSQLFPGKKKSSIYPCSNCIEAAKVAGYNEGFHDGQEITSRIRKANPESLEV